MTDDKKTLPSPKAKSDAAEVKTPLKLESKTDAPAPVTALPNAITKTGVGKVGESYVLGGDNPLPFKVPAWAGKAGDPVTITVGQPSKKWLGQNGGIDLRMSIFRSAKGAVVVMSHAKGIIVHGYPDSHPRSKILVEVL